MKQKPLLISLLISLGTGVIAGFLTFKSMEQYQEMYRPPSSPPGWVFPARELGFDNINMDLIVGLPGEDIHMVERTLEQIRELAPDSMTVHSLAVKRAARLNIFKEETA